MHQASSFIKRLMMTIHTKTAQPQNFTGTEMYRWMARKLADLRGKGYEYQFSRDLTALFCEALAKWIDPEDFEVDKYYHFEDPSHPDSDRVLYAISTTMGIRGFLVESCLVYEDDISHEMRAKLEFDFTAAKPLK